MRPGQNHYSPPAHWSGCFRWKSIWPALGTRRTPSASQWWTSSWRLPSESSLVLRAVQSLALALRQNPLVVPGSVQDMKHTHFLVRDPIEHELREHPHHGAAELRADRAPVKGILPHVRQTSFGFAPKTPAQAGRFLRILLHRFGDFDSRVRYDDQPAVQACGNIGCSNWSAVTPEAGLAS